MIKRVLIADRGAVVSRIIQAAGQFAINLVALYSVTSKDMLCLSDADSAVWIGESVPA